MVISRFSYIQYGKFRNFNSNTEYLTFLFDLILDSDDVSNAIFGIYLAILISSSCVATYFVRDENSIP